jgi:hypothetical protein
MGQTGVKIEWQPPRPAYLARPSTVYIILGSFLVLTVPLAAIYVFHADWLAEWHVIPIYVWVLGVTHFVITLTIYLQSANLRYFNSSWKNRTLYFVIPAGIFILFDLYSVLQVAARLPRFDDLFRRGIRFFDFHHVNRQSYGVMQMFKGRAQSPFPVWMKKTESAYFWSLTALLLLTFWNKGEFDTDEPLMFVALGVVGVLFLIIIMGFGWSLWQSTRRGALVPPLLYFLMQSGSAALGAYSTPLWMFGLAMHYVEYHVLMVPRCFEAPLDASSKADRFFASLRRSKLRFYMVLLVLAGGVTALTWSAMGPMLIREQSSGPNHYLVLLAIFDGLFIFHYFVEGLIWKFSQPFYRQTLGPLYFGNRRSPAPAPATSAGSI